MARFFRSKDGLTRCGDCGRHVASASVFSETQCPFCGGAVTRSERRVMSGRGAVVAASLMGFSAACGGAEPAEEPGPAVQTENGNEAPPAEDPAETPSEPENAEEPPLVEAYGMPPEEAEELPPE
ncbi:MAG: hypothetical protein AAGF12_26995 [Myxococcota bacterium]